MSVLTLVSLLVAAVSVAWAIRARRRAPPGDGGRGWGGAEAQAGAAKRAREAERAKEEAEGRFRTMVEHAPEAIMVVDVETERVVDFNQRTLRLFDRTAEEFRAAMPHQYSPERQPDGRRSVDVAADRVRRALDGEVPSFEWVVLRGDGRRLLTEVRLVRLPPLDRKLIQATVRDVTETRQAEEALRESEERYRALFEQDVVGNYVSSVDGTVIACNRAFADIFGFREPEEAIGFDVARLYGSAEDRESLLQAVRTQGKLDFFELDARTVHGEPLHLALNVRGVFDDEGRLEELWGHLSDLTERRALEHQLQQAQRMEAVGRLAGGIAHDFNNLLTTVTGHSDLVLSDPRLPDDLRDDLERIKKAVTRAARLTAQLVAFSHKESVETVSLDLNHTVGEVAEMLRRVIGENVRLEIDQEPDLWAVEADPGQLEQVLMNLALNARDAMPRGGDLVIRTANERMEERAETGAADVRPGRYVVLEVEDTGHGIPEDRIDRIFEPFYTSKESGKGSGLGLAMVYGITRRAGGHVRVDSTLGKGTVFRVFLPAITDRGRARAGAHGLVDEGSDAHAGERTTVLLLQRDPAVSKAAARILQREGYAVLEATDPDDALSFCQEWHGSIHVVLSDRLSGTDERRVREALGEHREGTSVIWTWEEETEVRPPQAPTDGLLRKPFSAQELGQRIREAVTSRRSDAASDAGSRASSDASSERTPV